MDGGSTRVGIARLPPRQLLGWAISIAGAFAAIDLFRQWLALADPRVTQALWGGLLAAGATAAGTLPAWITAAPGERTRDALLGFGAGVMLAACAFSLVVPGIAAAEANGHGPWGAGLVVGAGILAGALLLFFLERVVPHEHFIKGSDQDGAAAIRMRRAWLFVFAIVLHNVPEGLAIGVGFAGGDPVGGTALATGIAIQDVPEGLVIALALTTAGYGRLTAAALGVASGLVEPVAAVIGAAVVTTSGVLLPWGLAFAAGAMLFVISHEIIPESHRQGHERHATGGLMIGFVVMTVLDTALV
jgi:ZIP family zinc transporter